MPQAKTQNPPTSTAWMSAFSAARWARGITLLEWARHRQPAEVAILESADCGHAEKYSRKVKRLQAMITDESGRERLDITQVGDQAAAGRLMLEIVNDEFAADNRLSAALRAELKTGGVVLGVPGEPPFGEVQKIPAQHVDEIIDGILWPREIGTTHRASAAPIGLRLFKTEPHTQRQAELPAAGEVEMMRTGAPGRPSVMHLVVSEFDRRAKARRIEPTVAAQAKVLAGWLTEKHPTAPRLTPKTIENNIRGTYRKTKQSLA